LSFRIQLDFEKALAGLVSGVTEAGGCGIISNVAGHLRRRCRYASRTTSARSIGRGFHLSVITHYD